MKTYLLILLIGLVNAASAQNKTFKARGDKAFLIKDYTTAAFYYNKALENGAITARGKVPYFSVGQTTDSATVNEIRYQLAEAYRLGYNYSLAERWYKQVLNQGEATYPLARLWYGSCLRANNALDEAVFELKLFLSTSQEPKGDQPYLIIANNELKDCLFAIKQQKLKPTATIEKLANHFSSDENDFALNINGGKYWFTGTTAAAKHNNLNQIFVSNKDSLSKTTSIGFIPDKKLAAHFGTPSLDLSGQKMYLTMWYKEGDKVVAGIYLSRYIDQQWSAPKKLSNYVNAVGYHSIQPFVTPDGKQLYFVSNRRGGQGGDDIWLSELSEEGLPINVLNMGKAINTAADENTPFFDLLSKSLVFSSKGYVGMGNFDLYESIKKTDTSWTVPRNLGGPYNSTKDDLYYFKDDKVQGVAYISSDRESECCLNLFRINFAKPPLQAALFVGKVTDCDSQRALAGVKVALIDSATKQTFTAITDHTGKYEFKISVRHAYLLRLEKEGYFAKTIPVQALATFKKDTLYSADNCLQMFVVDKPIVIENVLYDFSKAILKPESMKVLDGLVWLLSDNPEIKIELSAHTDSVGAESYNNRLSQQRAQSCVDYLIYSGISATRLIARGYGETRPVQPNSLPDGKDNREGRRLNRRTEFKVLSAN